MSSPISQDTMKSEHDGGWVLSSPLPHIAQQNYTYQPSSDKTMPKHFAQPLTCFYWYHHGQCTKPDAECWYAHWDTGVVACAPVSVNQRRPAAGKHAADDIRDVSRREDALKAHDSRLDDREAILNAQTRAREIYLDAREQAMRAREHDLDMRDAELKRDINMSENEFRRTPETAGRDDDEMAGLAMQLKNAMRYFIDTLEDARASSNAARRVLTRRRNEIVWGNGDLSEARNDVCKAIDGAVGAIAGMDLALQKIESQVVEKIGAPGGVHNAM